MGRGRIPVSCFVSALSLALALILVTGTEADELKIGQPHKLVSGYTAGATLADWHGDGVLDIIICGYGTARTSRQSLSIARGSDMKGVQLPVHLSLHDINTVAAVADLNKNGRLETVFGNDGGYIIAFDTARQKIWQYESRDKVSSAPALADLDGDELPEVVFGNRNGDVIAITGNEGKEVWKYESGGSISSSPAVGDIDGDGDMDVVIGSEDSHLYALEGLDGSLLWSFNTTGSIRSTPAIGDLDGDGRTEVVVGSDDGVYVLDGDGNKIWSKSAGGGIGRGIASPVTIADLDNDGYTDILVGSSDGEVHAYNFAKRSKAWTEKIGGRIATALLVGDVDGNGSMEILALSDGSRKSKAYFLNGTKKSGSQILWSHDFNERIESHPAMADLDGDGRIEIVIGPYLFQSSGSGEIRWSQFAGDPSNSGLLNNALKYASDPLIYPKKPEDAAYVPILPRKQTKKVEGILPNTAVFADMNGDGVLDIVAVEKSAGLWRKLWRKLKRLGGKVRNV